MLNPVDRADMLIENWSCAIRVIFNNSPMKSQKELMRDIYLSFVSLTVEDFKEISGRDEAFLCQEVIDLWRDDHWDFDRLGCLRDLLALHYEDLAETAGGSGGKPRYLQ